MKKDKALTMCCFNCAFAFKTVGVQHEVQCRRNPPTVIVVPPLVHGGKPTREIVMPIVRAETWCGEFKMSLGAEIEANREQLAELLNSDQISEDEKADLREKFRRAEQLAQFHKGI